MCQTILEIVKAHCLEAKWADKGQVMGSRGHLHNLRKVIG